MDSANPAASPEDIQRKFRALIQADREEDDLLSRTSTVTSDYTGEDGDETDVQEGEKDLETSDETDSASKTGPADKQEKKKRLARLRRRSIAVQAYDFVGKDSDVSGIIFMEVQKVTDLPPERNSESSVDCISLSRLTRTQ